MAGMFGADNNAKAMMQDCMQTSAPRQLKKEQQHLLLRKVLNLD